MYFRTKMFEAKYYLFCADYDQYLSSNHIYFSQLDSVELCLFSYNVELTKLIVSFATHNSTCALAVAICCCSFSFLVFFSKQTGLYIWCSLIIYRKNAILGSWLIKTSITKNDSTA